MNYYVDRILKETKITDFLEERGIFPARQSGEKLFYNCPVHDGDNTPSFVVFPAGEKGREYQTYHCFACHSGINLINLKSDIDNISKKEAIGYFLKDIEINDEEALDSILEKIIKEEDGIEDQKQIESLLLVINDVTKWHLVICDDEEERLFFDDFFKKVDKIARERDVETLEGILDILIFKHGLEKRVDKFNERLEEKKKLELEWKL